MKRFLMLLVFGFLLGSNAFAGCIEGNCRNGQGTFTWPEGHKYVGGWKDGREHGQGTFTWANGDKYVGEFKDGKRHGQGTFTGSDGTVEKVN